MDTETTLQGPEHAATPHRSRLATFRDKHTHRHDGANAAIEEFFENLIRLFGMPVAPRPVEVRVDDARHPVVTTP